MKIIYENCGVKNYRKVGHRSYRRNFCCSKEPLTSFHKFITNQFNDLLPVGLLAQLVRALYRYRRGQGLESCTSLNVFQAFFSQLQKLRL